IVASGKESFDSVSHGGLAAIADAGSNASAAGATDNARCRTFIEWSSSYVSKRSKDRRAAAVIAATRSCFHLLKRRGAFVQFDIRAKRIVDEADARPALRVLGIGPVD